MPYWIPDATLGCGRRQVGHSEFMRWTEEEAQREYRKNHSHFSLIIPSCGRSTLENTVNSALYQLPAPNEIIVVGSRRPNIEAPNLKFIFFNNGGCDESGLSSLAGSDQQQGWHSAYGTDVGTTEHDIGYAYATGGYLAHCDDDDIFLPGAFNVMRKAMLSAHDFSALHLFRMRYGCHEQWLSPHCGREGIHCIAQKQADWTISQWGHQSIVTPNWELVPRWRIFNRDKTMASDWSHIKRYIEVTKTTPEAHMDVIGIIRPTMKDLVECLPPGTVIPQPLRYAPQPGWNGVPRQ